MLQKVSKKLAVAFVVMAGFTLFATPQAYSYTLEDNPSGKDLRQSSSPQNRSFNATFDTKASSNKNDSKAECPPDLKCKYVPAAYKNNNPADPVDYGNYDTANRPQNGMKINSVIIHDAEGSCQAVLDAFQNPTFYASSHYLVCADGTVYQMVKNKDVAWHAGNWWYNMHSIGIEHEGHAALGGSEYTPQMYKASAKLVKWLSQKYDFPTTRQHVIGHDNIPATRDSQITAMHVDPGPFWNWQKYMALMGAPVTPSGSFMKSKLVTIAPTWPLSQLPVEGCWPEDLPSCTPIGQQPTNFVYLRTAPNNTAPLLSDPVGGQGSTELGNNHARAFHGQKFAVADRKLEKDGMWYKIWYNGQLGWFYSPWKAPTAWPSNGKHFALKPGKESIPVYGRPLPEQSEYPADFTPPAGSVPYPQPLSYKVNAGQLYSVSDTNVANSHYFAWTYNSSLPYDHTVFMGGEKYLRIQYNSREAFVKAADVEIRY